MDIQPTSSLPQVSPFINNENTLLDSNPLLKTPPPLNSTSPLKDSSNKKTLTKKKSRTFGRLKRPFSFTKDNSHKKSKTIERQVSQIFTHNEEALNEFSNGWLIESCFNSMLNKLIDLQTAKDISKKQNNKCSLDNFAQAEKNLAKPSSSQKTVEQTFDDILQLFVTKIKEIKPSISSEDLEKAFILALWKYDKKKLASIKFLPLFLDPYNDRRYLNSLESDDHTFILTKESLLKLICPIVQFEDQIHLFLSSTFTRKKSIFKKLDQNPCFLAYKNNLSKLQKDLQECYDKNLTDIDSLQTNMQQVIEKIINMKAAVNFIEQIKQDQERLKKLDSSISYATNRKRKGILLYKVYKNRDLLNKVTSDVEYLTDPKNHKAFQAFQKYLICNNDDEWISFIYHAKTFEANWNENTHNENLNFAKKIYNLYFQQKPNSTLLQKSCCRRYLNFPQNASSIVKNLGEQIESNTISKNLFSELVKEAQNVLKLNHFSDDRHFKYSDFYQELLIDLGIWPTQKGPVYDY